LAGGEGECDDLLVDEGDEDRYRCARNGDHLMGVPFACDLCHFRNLNKRSPDLNDRKDVRTLWAIRRASLDALWAREPSTVRANLSRLRSDHRDAMSLFSMEDLLPRFGDSNLVDTVGMGEALHYLAASLRRGNYTANVQYETTRITSSWLSNLDGASGRYAGTGDRDRSWVVRFKRGMRLRMGEVKYQNEPFTGDMALALHVLIDKEWSLERDEIKRERLESLMCYVLIGLGAGLRGEEVPLTTCNGLATYWEETANDPDPYIMITLRGRFKAETGDRWHCLPICDVNRTGIPYRTWVRRLMRRRTGEEGANKWLLRGNQGARAKISDYDPMFCSYLHRLRSSRPALFSEATMMDMFSLRRSMRRGAIVATTGRVDGPVIDLINRWRKKEKAKGTQPSLNMHQTYSTVRVMYPTMKAYSKAI
jgi:hypothetical protein